jgi:DNA polymerase-4
MPSAEAFRRCPHAVFVRPDFSRYTLESRAVMELLRELSPAVEPLSLDEAFVDLTGTARLHGDPLGLGERIRARIRGERGLAASVGIARNRFVAKLATELAKPDGARWIRAGTEEATVLPLPLDVLFGVGPKTAAALRALGHATVADVLHAPAWRLPEGFAPHREELLRLCRGAEGTPVLSDREEKSRSMERTFAEDVTDRRRLLQELLEYAQELTHDLRARGLAAHVVRLKVRDDAFRTVTRSLTLARATNLPRPVFAAAKSMLDEVPLQKPVRLIGLALADLADLLSPRQATLFAENEDDPKEQRLAAALDLLRKRHGRAAGGPGPGWLPGG